MVVHRYGLMMLSNFDLYKAFAHNIEENKIEKIKKGQCVTFKGKPSY